MIKDILEIYKKYMIFETPREGMTLMAFPVDPLMLGIDEKSLIESQSSHHRFELSDL